MKLTGLICAGLFWHSEAVTTVSVDTCEELQLAAASTSTDDVVATMSVDGVSCDEWTTINVAANRLKLAPPTTAGYRTTDVLTFNNVRFAVSSGATLRVLPRVEFRGEKSQEVDGGVLNIAEGARVRFKGSASLYDITILSVTAENSDVSPDRWFGGCIYNKGILRFDSDLFATECATVGGGESAPGDGSGIWNGETGQVVIKGFVTIMNSGTRDINGNNGGAIYNAGKFSVFAGASIVDNQGSAGGGIYNIGVLKFLKKSVPVFSGNRASDTGGGHVKNVAPGRMLFNGGALFLDGFTEDSGGAIFNNGALSISKMAVFRDNRANSAGGAIFNLASADLVLPVDTSFEGNSVPDSSFSDCDNIFSFLGDGEFECLP